MNECVEDPKLNAGFGAALLDPKVNDDLASLGSLTLSPLVSNLNPDPVEEAAEAADWPSG